MKHFEKVTPLAAVLSGLLSIVCCLPLGIPAAIGLAWLAAVFSTLRPWLIGLSVALLAAGLFQLYRRRACRRLSASGVVIFGLATVVVLALALFPQSVAGILAGSGASAEQARVTELGPQSLDTLQEEFNRAAGSVRIILLLSPT